MNIFITGTDTNVGKTLISTILALKLNYKYWKPIQCGLSEMSDSDWVKQYIGNDRIQKETYSLRDPLSPHLAARNDNQEIHLHKIINQFPVDKTIIEGAGGLLVPLNAKEYLIDLIPKDKCKIILVARSTLGTINHTLLSIEALKNRNLDLWGVVMMGNKNHDNKLAIEWYGKTMVLAEIPFVKKINKESLLQISEQISLEKI
ncbi:MAG: dethiobiotin synthase [Bacteriovorax sp.]|nr:dethiobiotin synthase [Bacteriovorax sp.]